MEQGSKEMANERLGKELEQLHSELRSTRALDDPEREMLERLAADIQELLGRAPDEASHYSGLRDRLNDAAARLEASHPQATLLMRQVIDSMAYLGI